MIVPGWEVVLGGLGGLIAGSFVGAIATRWPEGRSIADGRSRCDACGTVLGVADLFPVLSFVRLRGKCRVCRAAIPPVHLVAELACAMIGASAAVAAPPALALAGALFGWTLVALALLDLAALWLPDRLTLPLGIAGVGIAAAGLGPSLTDSVIGAAAGYAALTLIAVAYRAVRGRTGLGGGDPKLLGAIGAWLGWTMLPFVLLLASLAGLAMIALRKARGEAVARTDALAFGALLAVAAWPLWLVRVAS